MSKRDEIGTHKTSVHTDDNGTTYVRYHKTVIAMRDNRGKITLDSGGWKTATTKTRMNQALRVWGTGYYVHQVKHVWYVGVHKGNGVHARICEYYDGVTLQ
jgi:hypothetical protein